MNETKEIMQNLKKMFAQARHPKMDNSHQIDINEASHLITKLQIKFEELEKQNEELKCCGNCSFYDPYNKIEKCLFFGYDERYINNTGKCEHWRKADGLQEV